MAGGIKIKMSFKLINFNEETEDILKCDKLCNDIIFMKYDVSINNIIEITENEFIILIYKGQVYDFKEEVGKYIVKETDLEIENEWENLFIRDAENNDLCVIFLNKNIIKNNKLLINKTIEKQNQFNGKLSKIELNIYIE